MALTRAQKAAGRAFRDARQAHLASLPPADARCSPYGPPWFRHACAAPNRGTVAIPLKVRADPVPAGDGVPGGLLEFRWLEGTCRKCGFTVRSGTGYVALAGPAPHMTG